MTEGMLYGGWLTTDQLSRILGLDPSTLRRWRTAEPLQGPPFVRMSAHVTLYSAPDVQRWMESKRIDPAEAA